MRIDPHERFFRAACVLVIDDDDGVRIAVSRLLEASGYRALAAASGKEGLALLEAHPGEVALCICDFKMPGLDGIETLTRLHEIDAEVLRVLLTGYATLDAAIEATNRGLDAFVTKPYQARELRTKLETLLSNRSRQLARERLGGIPLFRSLPDQVLAQIHPALQIERVARGQVVQEFGVASERLCIVAEGELQIEARMPDGRMRAIAHLGPGEHFGDGSLASGEPSPLRVVAAVETELLVLRRDEFQKLKDQHPQIAQAVASALTRQLHKVAGGSEHANLVVATEEAEALPGAALSVARALAGEGADVGFFELASSGEMGTEPGPHPLLRARNDAGLRRYRVASEARVSPQEIVRMLGALRQQHRVVLIELPLDKEIREAARGQAHRLLQWRATGAALVEASIVSLEPGEPVAPLHLLVARSSIEQTNAAMRRIARRILGTSLGLALGAGGARGVSHFGVLREFKRAGLELDALSGASIGAVVGGAIAGGYSLDAAEGILRAAFDHIVAGSQAFRSPAWERVWKLALQTFDGKTFEGSVFPFLCNATDLVSGNEVIFDRGPTGPAICASLATPGLFPPFHYQGGVFSDAALVNGLPTEELVSRGYDLVAAVDVFGSQPWRSPPAQPNGWRRIVSRGLPGLTHKMTSMRVVLRAIVLSTQHLVHARARGCDLTIRPNVPGGMSSFGKVHFPTIIEIGQKAAEPAARDLLARRAALAARWSARN